MKLQLFVAIVFTINQASCFFPIKPNDEVLAKQIIEQCKKNGGNEAITEVQVSISFTGMK